MTKKTKIFNKYSGWFPVLGLLFATLALGTSGIMGETKNLPVSGVVGSQLVQVTQGSSGATSRGYDPNHIGVRDWHLVQAEQYESRAAAMDQIIQEHQRMKAEFKAKGYVGEMDTHCDSVIQASQKLKADYLNFASWHRSQAAQNGAQ